MKENAPDDGGSAFPSETYGSEGMSLRDWFAGQAMTGIIAGTLASGSLNRSGEHVVREARIFADAMIAELKRPLESQAGTP